MSFPSIMFFLIFFIPLIGLLFWLMKEDKRKGKIGLTILAILVFIGLLLVYLMTRGK